MNVFHFGENIFTVRYFDFSDRDSLSVVTLKDTQREKNVLVGEKIPWLPVTESPMEIPKGN